EVIVLDSAGYGPVTITKSVSLISPAGIYAGISVTSPAGVVVNAPSEVVTLRGLTINGGGGGQNAVDLAAAKTFHMEDIVASGFVAGTGSALLAHADGVYFSVRDCEFR